MINPDGHLLLAMLGEEGDLVLHYQPLVDLSTRHIVGVEALLRWQHPTRGLLLPADLLDKIKVARLNPMLDALNLDVAAAQANVWRGAGVAVPIAINASPDSIAAPHFVGQVLAALDRFGLPTSAVEVEVLEDPASDERELAAGTRRLVAAGISVALDDFGAGASTLARVRALSLTTLKIDRAFVTDVITSTRSARVVRVAASLGRRRHMRVVAEGVEDEATVGFLQCLGVDTGQGFYLGRPTPAAALDGRLRIAA